MRRIFSLATILEREENLESVVLSIIKQADMLFINLINYKKIPDFLFKYNNIVINKFENKGSEIKFNNYNDINDDDYFFTIDDDILYPEDYSDILIENMIKYENKAVCCVHGSIINLNQKNNFHNTKGGLGRKSYHFVRELNENKLIMIPGTGTSCFYKKTFKLNLNEVKVSNMIDSYVGCFLYEQKILIYSIKRSNNWLKALKTEGRTIYGNNPNKEIDDLYIKTFKNG